jgi:hypothetical protein
VFIDWVIEVLHGEADLHGEWMVKI